jgi:hypothetical protein
MTTAKLKTFMFSVWGFAVSNITYIFIFMIVNDWVELMLWPTVRRPIRLGVGHPFGAHDQIFIFIFFCMSYGKVEPGLEL